MYKLISLYRSLSAYPANARIVRVSATVYHLFIVHDTVGTVLMKKDTYEACLHALFSFSPVGYGGKTIFWKKVNGHGD